MNKWLFLVLLGLNLSLHAAVLDPAKGKTEFLAIGRPAALRINGTGAGPTGYFSLKKVGQDYFLNGEAIFDLATLDTGIAMRDRHMKETYLEIEKFKTAKLFFKDVKIPLDKITGGGAVTFSATLELHGKESPVEVEINLTPNATDISTSAKFKVNLSTFGVEIPKYAGITVASDVTVTTQTQISKAALVEVQ